MWIFEINLQVIVKHFLGHTSINLVNHLVSCRKVTPFWTNILVWKLLEIALTLLTLLNTSQGPPEARNDLNASLTIRDFQRLQMRHLADNPHLLVKKYFLMTLKHKSKVITLKINQRLPECIEIQWKAFKRIRNNSICFSGDFSLTRKWPWKRFLKGH